MRGLAGIEGPYFLMSPREVNRVSPLKLMPWCHTTVVDADFWDWVILGHPINLKHSAFQ